MKKLLKEQKDRTVYLKQAYDAGCIVKLFKPVKTQDGKWGKSDEQGYLIVQHDRDGKGEKWAIFQFNKDSMPVFYYEDGVKTLLKTGEPPIQKTWSCDVLDKVAERNPTLDDSNMTNVQKNEITYLLSQPDSKNPTYRKDNPDGKDARTTNYQKVDVSTITDISNFDKTVFQPNTYFVYKLKELTPAEKEQEKQQKTSQANEDKKNKLETLINKYGYTLIQPDPNTPEYRKKTTLRNLPYSGPEYVDWYGSDPTIYGYEGKGKLELQSGAYDQKTCRTKIKELFGYLQNPDSQPAQAKLRNEKDLLQLKNDVAYCKNNRSFASGALGVNDELEKLYQFISRRNPFGMADFNQQTESKKNMKKIIRETLIEVQQKKQKLLKEEKIISSRLNYLLENYNPKKKNKFYNDIISEFFYLSNQGFDTKTLLQEENKFLDVLKSLFSHKWDSVAGQLKEYFAMWIINKFGLPKTSIWASMISVAVGNLPFSDIKSIMNCDGFTKFMTKTITEGMIKQLQTKTELNSIFFDYLRNALVESLTQDSEFGKKVEGMLGSLICPALSKLSDKFGNMENKLKQTVVSGT
jgi:hypothetical protein